MGQPIYLSAEDHARITEAVTQAEHHTAGEIVTVLADRSDGYSDVQLAWAALAALLKLLGFALLPALPLTVADAVMGTWNTQWHPQGIFVLASFAAALAFAVVWLVQQWDAVRFALIPGPIRARRVQHRALRAFRLSAERRTRGRTGILIYVSMREHRAEIIADQTIAEKVDPDVWGDALHALLLELKQGRTADGMIAAVAKVGAVLSNHLPIASDDANELPDRLIEV
jgi:putative membrane protein